MADPLSLLVHIAQKYFVDLGLISQAASQKALNKGLETAGKSIFSSLKDYAQQGTAEGNEKIEKLKKQPIIERLRYLYGDNTFTGRYGIDIIKVSVVIFIFMCAVTYFQIQIKLNEVKYDWPQYRCRPDVMPFAGWINAPEGVDPMEYTKQNFMECSSNMTKGVFDKPMVMVYAIFNTVMKIFKKILEVIETLRIFLNKIRDTLKELFLAIFNRIQNVIIPVQVMLIKMVDFFEKIKGILATFLLTFVGVLWSFYSLIGSVYEYSVCRLGFSSCCAYCISNDCDPTYFVRNRVASNYQSPNKSYAFAIRI
jgi:hypothetical protein